MGNRHWHLWKKFICGLLCTALLLAEVPMTAYADTDRAIPGDVNRDGVVNRLDFLAFKQYLVGDRPSGFFASGADINQDGRIDIIDLLLLAKALGIHPNGGQGFSNIAAVKFYAGSDLIETQYIEKGKTIGALPSAKKSARAEKVLLGYYQDSSFAEPFYADVPITQDMNVYARYQDMDRVEELNFTSFAKMEQDPNLSFEIRKDYGDIEPQAAAVLAVKDGSAAVLLIIEDPDNDGTYTVKADGGFREGCAYEITLEDGWVFKDKAKTIRTAAFTIRMDPVKNLRMNNEIVYIEDTAALTFSVGGQTFEQLNSEGAGKGSKAGSFSRAAAESAISRGETVSGGDVSGGDVSDGNAGSAPVSRNADDSTVTVQVGDILCIYEGIKPTDRRGTEDEGEQHKDNNRDFLGSAIYVKVVKITGDTIDFDKIGTEEQKKLYATPDNFPISLTPSRTSQDVKPDPNEGSVSGGDVSGGDVSGGDVSGGNAGGASGADAGGASGADAGSGGNAGAAAGANAQNAGADSRQGADGPQAPEPTSPPLTFNLENYLDRKMYAIMLGTMDENQLGSYMTEQQYDACLQAAYEEAEKRIGVGDFLTIYQTAEYFTREQREKFPSTLTFGVITGYDPQTGEITYEETTREAILKSGDLYSQPGLNGMDLISDEDKDRIENTIQVQLAESDFATEAAFLLADLVAETDGFQENALLRQALLSDEESAPFSAGRMQRGNIGKNFELGDVKIAVTLIREGKQLHFGNGVQLAVKVDAPLEVEVEDGKIAIDLSATFVQEIELTPSVRGSLTTVDILGIPIPNGVEVSASVDIKNFTAFSFSADIYTVAAEDNDVWSTIQSICNDPASALDLPGIPDNLKDGLKRVGDVMDKISEIQGKIDQAAETAEAIAGYRRDLEALWSVAEANVLNQQNLTRKDWEEMCKTLQKTSIASELLGLIDMTDNAPGITPEYLETIQELIDKYTETLQRSTDWVTLVDREIFSSELNFYGLVLGVSASFVVRADMSISIGSNLQYEMGKRYTVWFKIGLYPPTSGTSTMDILDERFAFQFYVMGKLGLKIGVKAKVYAGIGSGKFASVGLTAELGPYIKLYGMFVYEHTKYRPANTQNWTVQNRMAGALYLEFGLYFIMGVEANALGDLFTYSKDFLNLEIPLLTAGDKNFYYDTAYQPQEDEFVRILDEDGNSTNGISMKIPESCLSLSYVDLTTGSQGQEAKDYNQYAYMLSSPYFAIDPKTGYGSVKPPKNARYIECDLTATYLQGKMAFSQYDMAARIPLVWTNLATSELKEAYTISVRIPKSNNPEEDGYKTVWSKTVHKNQEYDLPKEAEIQKILGYSGTGDLQFSALDGYEDAFGDELEETEGLTCIEDTVYYYDVTYREYSVTVTDVEKKDGGKETRTFRAPYGKAFDFSELEKTGTEIDGQKYTKFTQLTATAAGQSGQPRQPVDLTQEIDMRLAGLLAAGSVQAKANYRDDSVKATFTFTGRALRPGMDANGIPVTDTNTQVVQILRQGKAPNEEAIVDMLLKEGLAIEKITPEPDYIRDATVYQVVCCKVTDNPYTKITFDVGPLGSPLDPILRMEGRLLGKHISTRRGYTQGSWYEDKELTKPTRIVPKTENLQYTVYARWIPNKYQVKFNAGKGTLQGAAVRTVEFDNTYGNAVSTREPDGKFVYSETALPTPTRKEFKFLGWYTEYNEDLKPDETRVLKGQKIEEGTKMEVDADHTLYALWQEKKTIPDSVVTFTPKNTPYKKGESVTAEYQLDESVISQNNLTGLTKDYFGSPQYIRQTSGSDSGSNEYLSGAPVNAGTYNMRLYREETEEYKKFDFVYDAVLTIDQADRSLSPTGVKLTAKTQGYTFLQAAYESGIDDLSSQAQISYSASGTFWSTDGYIYDLAPNTTYPIQMKVTGDPNYKDASGPVGSLKTLPAPTGKWTDHAASLQKLATKEIYIGTAAELAALAKEVNSGNDDMANWTIKLTADIDLTGYEWVAIGIDENKKCFRGTFDGQYHKITGLYLDETAWNQGLFGCIASPDDGTAKVTSVLLDASYIKGSKSTGGIVGKATQNTVIERCTNYAQIVSTDDHVGGIVGYANGTNKEKPVLVRDCVNYGAVSTSTKQAGGIAGFVEEDRVYNNANFGSIKGTQDVGGIVGISWGNDAKIENNLNAGTVTGGKYCGQITGSPYGGGKATTQGYYLSVGNGKNAVGKDSGCWGDDSDKSDCASFASASSALSRDCGYGTNLSGALSKWVTDVDKNSTVLAWSNDGPDGYPTPNGAPKRK